MEKITATAIEAAGKKLSLVELNNAHAGLVARLIELGGELTPETEAELETLLGQLCDKADAYGVVLKQLENNAEFWKQQKMECAAAQSVYEKAQDRLRDRMKFVLSKTDGEALQGQLFRFFLARSTPKINVVDELLPAQYKTTQLVISADRDAIKAAIAKGEIPAGVTVEETKALRIGRPK